MVIGAKRNQVAAGVCARRWTALDVASDPSLQNLTISAQSTRLKNCSAHSASRWEGRVKLEPSERCSRAGQSPPGKRAEPDGAKTHAIFDEFIAIRPTPVSLCRAQSATARARGADRRPWRRYGNRQARAGATGRRAAFHDRTPRALLSATPNQIRVALLDSHKRF